MVLELTLTSLGHLRKQPKFFDIQTYTGSGESGQTISHNLGVARGMVIVKDTSATGKWYVYHRSLGSGEHLKLNTTDAVSTDSNYEIGKTTASATQFSIDTGSEIDASGNTYVAYFFAHNNDDGGFGEHGDQDIIKCDKIDSTSDDVVNVTLGFEPQFIMIKKSSTTGDWQIFDNIRGMPHGADDQILAWNTNGAESNSNRIKINPDGFTASGFGTNTDYIYMAIRRGGMQTPSTATDVFKVDQGHSSNIPNFESGFPVDFGLLRQTSSDHFKVSARLTDGKYLETSTTAAESSNSNYSFDHQDGWVGSAFGTSYYSWMWKRARGFCDVVCYTGDSTSKQDINHNLGVAPEMIWIKNRDQSGYNWIVGTDELGGWNYYVTFNNTSQRASSTAYFGNTAPTSSQFSVGQTSGQDDTNRTTYEYIAYLFASVSGVSKIGSYTGNGSTQTIDCGFDPRFILTKKIINGNGGWFVFDTERGIVAGNDPYMLLNTSDAQVTSADTIDPTTNGFTVNDNNTNANSDTYLFYAIA